MTSALLVGLLLVAWDGAEKADPDQANLEGSWRVVSTTTNGREDTDIKGLQFTFRKDQLVLPEPGNKAEEVLYRLDSAKTPKQLDFELTIFKTDWVLGIYQLDKDTLTYCLSSGDNKRPDKFEAPEGSGRTLLKMERVKK